MHTLKALIGTVAIFSVCTRAQSFALPPEVTPQVPITVKFDTGPETIVLTPVERSTSFSVFASFADLALPVEVPTPPELVFEGISSIESNCTIVVRLSQDYNSILEGVIILKSGAMIPISPTPIHSEIPAFSNVPPHSHSDDEEEWCLIPSDNNSAETCEYWPPNPNLQVCPCLEIPPEASRPYTLLEVDFIAEADAMLHVQFMNGSVPDTTAYLTYRVHLASLILQRELGVRLALSNVFVEYYPTAYSEAIPPRMYSEIRNKWNSPAYSLISRDHVHVFSGYRCATGAALQGGACPYMYHSNWSYSTHNRTLNGNGTYPCSTNLLSEFFVFIHEIGHSLGHPNDCMKYPPYADNCGIMDHGAGEVNYYRFNDGSAAQIRNIVEKSVNLSSVGFWAGRSYTLSDDFESDLNQFDATKWNLSASNGVTLTPINPAMKFNGADVARLTPTTTPAILQSVQLSPDGSSASKHYLGLWLKHPTSSQVTAVRVESLSSPGSWTTIASITGNQFNSINYTYFQTELPNFVPGTTIRIRALGGVGVLLDNITVGRFCRVDINRDGVVNQTDDDLFDEAFDIAGSLPPYTPFDIRDFIVADWNRDGTLNALDQTKFQTDWSAGCY